ncbi:putative tripartite motif-containing protein 49B [Cynocephalus volans]|uniref:putative tripartite motif-containing protein 49B n=1 Tax=Cynocephalus volans TaxID=110931 RepID=UPI002FC79A2B
MEKTINSTHRNMDSNTFQNEFICSVCMNYFIDPVTIGCGHSFCRPCLCMCWEEAPHPPSCPVCRTTSHEIILKTNIVLKTRVFLARRARPYQLPSSAEDICGIHRKTKNFFCEVVKDVLCSLCCKSKEHVGHRHCSVDWTAEEYRQKLLKQMRSVWEKTQENQRNLNRETSVIQMWMHFGTMLKRSESVQLHMPQPVNPELSSWPITGLIDRLNQFQVYISWEDEIAACHVPLFEDLRHLLSTPALLDVVHNPTRSKSFLTWGAQPFTSGRHYWEVDVGGCGNWIIGFCNDSWTKRNDMMVNSEGIFLLFCVKEETCCRLFTSSPLLPHYVERPLGPVGVFLDYECGTLSFVNAAHSSLIYVASLSLGLVQSPLERLSGRRNQSPGLERTLLRVQGAPWGRSEARVAGASVGAGMWNLLPETDSAAVAGRRPRQLCAGALVLAGGLFSLGFLCGRGALPAVLAPSQQLRGPGTRGPAADGVLLLISPRGGALGAGRVGRSPRELGGASVAWGAVQG